MTDVGKPLVARGQRSDWGGLYFDGRDAESGSVTEAEAQLLYALVRATKPQAIVEIGTSYGYSALHLAEGLKDNGGGHLYTVEIIKARQDAAISNINDAGLAKYVSFCDVPPELKTIDLAFVDAKHDEESLREYLNAVGHAKLIVVHDAAWQDHLARAIAGTRSMVMLPTDSFMKMAMVSNVASVEL